MSNECLNADSLVFREYFDKIRSYLIERDDRNFILDDYFTPHDSAHCYAIETIINLILSKWKYDLTELEKFLLLLSIWGHDLGMFSDIAKEYFNENNIKYDSSEKRRIHDLISAWHLSKHYKDIFLDIANTARDFRQNRLTNTFRSYIHVINIIIKYHRRVTNISECPEYVYLSDEKIRCRLLACLLRLGDTLHVDSSRYDERSYNILQLGEFDRFSRLHWLKSYMISNIYLDDINQIVAVNIDLPDVKDINIEIDDICDGCGKCVVQCPRGVLILENNSLKITDPTKCYLCKKCMKICDKNAIIITEINWKENIRDLEFFISNDIHEDLISVSDTFREHELPTYLTVKCNTNLVQGFDKQKAQEILGVLSDLDLIFSPNSTRTITKALESIKSLSKMHFDNYILFYRHLDQLVDHLQEISVERPCHIGLKKIIEHIRLLKDIFDTEKEKKHGNVDLNDIKRFQSMLSDLVDNIRRERKSYWNKIYTQEKLKHIDGIKNIFLFGYSEMVSKYLKEYSDLDHSFLTKANIYVFEGASKRRYSTNNLLEYHDGTHYAIQLSKMGFKNIKLLPDFASASIFNILNTKAEQVPESEYIDDSVVLFGANGIDYNKRIFAHSSGHLALAIIAKKFKIPVIVIADSFKMGDFEWNLSATRKTDWLTTQKNILNDLECHNIELVNYREDIIHSEYIATIISDRS